MIIVDSAEKEEKIGLILEKLYGLGYDIKPQKIRPSGDYMFGDGNIIVERKTVEDFDGSFTNTKSTNIWDQMQRMREWLDEREGRYAFLVIIGNLSYNNSYANVSEHQRMGAVASIASRYGIPVVTAATESGFAYLLHKWYRNYQDGEFGVARKLQFKPSDYGNYSEYVLNGIGGIGPDKYKAILEDFEVEVKLKPKSNKTLLEVKGIGPSTMKKITDKVKVEAYE